MLQLREGCVPISHIVYVDEGQFDYVLKRRKELINFIWKQKLYNNVTYVNRYTVYLYCEFRKESHLHITKANIKEQ